MVIANHHEAVVLTLLEKKTENYLAIRIPGKTGKAVMDAIAALRAEYGQHSPQVFKTITVDNGSEFAGFTQTRHGTARFSLPTPLHLMGACPERAAQRPVPVIHPQGRLH